MQGLRKGYSSDSLDEVKKVICSEERNLETVTSSLLQFSKEFQIFSPINKIAGSRNRQPVMKLIVHFTNVINFVD